MKKSNCIANEKLELDQILVIKIDEKQWKSILGLFYLSVMTLVRWKFVGLFSSFFPDTTLYYLTKQKPNITKKDSNDRIWNQYWSKIRTEMRRKKNRVFQFQSSYSIFFFSVFYFRRLSKKYFTTYKNNHAMYYIT